jgi:hypothetical protein
MRRLLTSSALLATVLLLGACERLLGPSREVGGNRPRYGDYVLPVGRADVPRDLQVADSITVSMESLDPAACSYGGSGWLVHPFRAYIVPFGVRAGNPRCLPVVVRLPSPSQIVPRGRPRTGEVALPVRIVVCQPDAEPLTTITSIDMPVESEEGRATYGALRERLLAEHTGADAARTDREVCAQMVKW